MWILQLYLTFLYKGFYFIGILYTTVLEIPDIHISCHLHSTELNRHIQIQIYNMVFCSTQNILVIIISLNNMRYVSTWKELNKSIKCIFWLMASLHYTILTLIFLLPTVFGDHWQKSQIGGKSCLLSRAWSCIFSCTTFRVCFGDYGVVWRPDRPPPCSAPGGTVYHSLILSLKYSVVFDTNWHKKKKII